MAKSNNIPVIFFHVSNRNCWVTDKEKALPMLLIVNISIKIHIRGVSKTFVHWCCNFLMTNDNRYQKVFWCSIGMSITNLRTFQHGHPWYLGALQKTSSLDVLMNRIFLTSKTTKSTKRCQILDWCQSKLFQKHLMSFLCPDVVQCPCLYRHPLEIQPDYVISC